MDAAPKRVAAHIIRKPAVEPAVCEVIENPAETSRVDVRELQHMLAKSSSAPIDLETDIEVVADTAEAPAPKPTRLAHTVRRADSAPIVAEPPAVTVEMPAIQAEPIVAAAPPARDRWTMVAVGALAVASVGLLVAVLM